MPRTTLTFTRDSSSDIKSSYTRDALNDIFTSSVIGEVDIGSTVDYNVSCELYQTKSGSMVINEDTTLDVILEDSTATLTITYDGSDVVDFKITDDNGNVLHQHEYYDDTPTTITFDRNNVKTLYLTDLSSNPESRGNGVMEYSATGCDASGDGPYYYELTLTNLTQNQSLYLYFFYGPL